MVFTVFDTRDKYITSVIINCEMPSLIIHLTSIYIAFLLHFTTYSCLQEINIFYDTNNSQYLSLFCYNN